MKKSLGAAVAVIGAALLGLVFFARVASIPAAAQQRGGVQAPATPAPAKPVPRTPWDAKPNLTGVWGGPLPAAGTPTAAERGAAIAELARTYQPWALERSSPRN